MGLFSTNYNKPGPGVSRNERKRKGLFLYIQIVFRKFLKLMQASFLYTVFSLPYLFLAFEFISPLFMNAFGFTRAIMNTTSFTPEDIAYMEVWLRVVLALAVFNFIGFAPVSASYAFVTRCFTRGEHAWILSDGKDILIGNIKQSLLLFLFDCVIIFLTTNAINFYRILEEQNVGGMANVFFFLRYIMYSVLAVFTFMHYYIYQIMVTYECKFIDLLKNSVIIAIAKLPMTVLLTVICGAIFGVGVYFVSDNPFLFAIIYSIIGITFTRYPMEFYASRVLDKNIRIENKKKENKKARINYIEE